MAGLNLRCLLLAPLLAAALRVEPPITTRRTLLSRLVIATSLAATPALAEQAAAPLAEQAAVPLPPEVFRPPIKVASAEEQAELEKARLAMPTPEPPKGSDLDRMLATGGSFGVLDHGAPIPR
eukprot:CAMPEP_0119059688 /NCGR_PEP_ID=MMETSP1178-20130426/3754_1 /TAXON_ID=33656 /ORGANISM="unid sp, Strain CCMP2000" /LENGTH=122 /DNA_ID=CAMNT_0007040737 /DNA_START=25 /DNA_END=393 /DNA_ORIENTATION=-